MLVFEGVDIKKRYEAYEKMRKSVVFFLPEKFGANSTCCFKSAVRTQQLMNDVALSSLAKVGHPVNSDW